MPLAEVLHLQVTADHWIFFIEKLHQNEITSYPSDLFNGELSLKIEHSNLLHEGSLKLATLLIH